MFISQIYKLLTKILGIKSLVGSKRVKVLTCQCDSTELYLKFFVVYQSKNVKIFCIVSENNLILEQAYLKVPLY